MPNINESVYSYDEKAIKERTSTDRPVHPLILSRRSLYAMTGAPIDDQLLLNIFEAARWAPSLYNTQLWRFVYAKRDTEYWPKYLDTLVELNQNWARNASALVVALSKKTFTYNGKVQPCPTHQWDSGAAWMAWALEGAARGLVIHPMAGFHKDKIEKVIQLNTEEYEVHAMIAIGYPDVGKINEEKVTTRNTVEQFLFKDVFTEKI